MMSKVVVFTHPETAVAGIVRPAGTSISRACKDRRLCTSVTIDGKTYAALSEITTMNAAGETETRSERVPTPVGDLIVQILGRAVLFSDDLVDATNPEYAETEEQFLERVVYPSIPQGATNIRIADDTEVPADRTFRNAWTPDLTVDMAKARELHKDTLRGLRSPQLAALDVEYQRADEAGDKTAKRDIAARKQALRDVTKHPAISAATTPDELKAAVPKILTNLVRFGSG